MAENKSTAPETLTLLGTDVSLHVRRSLLANPKTPHDTLATLAADAEVVEGWEWFLANNAGAPIALRERVNIEFFDKEVLATLVNTALESPIFDVETGDPIPGVACPGVEVLSYIIDQQGAHWTDAPARDLLFVAPEIVAYNDAAVEVFFDLAEGTPCSLPDLVQTVKAVLG